MSTFASTNPTRWLAGAALLALLTSGAAACSSDAGSISSKTKTTDTSSVEAEQTEEEAAEDESRSGTEDGAGVVTDGGQPGGGQPGGAQAGGAQAGGAQAGGSATGGGQDGGSGGGTQTAAPLITSLDHPDKVNCHNGMFQTFGMRWTTTGADSVTISIDGPGIYDTYGPNGEASLPFSCDTPHTFLVTAHGPGGTATKQVTLHGRNVPGSPSEPEDQMDQHEPDDQTDEY